MKKKKNARLPVTSFKNKIFHTVQKRFFTGVRKWKNNELQGV